MNDETPHFVTMHVTAAVGYFGPVFHSYTGCGDTRPTDEFVTLALSEADLRKLSGEWFCFKCGDILQEWAHGEDWFVDD